MDQVKTFLRQCVKYRFWIAVGISMLLPMIGYFVGSGAYTEATAKAESEIKAADTDVAKYTTPNPPNGDYKPVVDEKLAVLAKDVNATQQALYDRQEPLLQWPERVENKFRNWGRKWPENVDRGQVQAVIYDYTTAYPDFVSKVYKTFNPWSPEDGSGIVFAPDQTSLIKPAPFTLQAPPDLSKVWSEQERLWVVTALLDVVAQVNKDAGAKDWDGAWIKQIIDIDVGSMAAQDQKSLAKGVALKTADPLVPEGTAAPEEAAVAGPEMMMGGMMSGMGAGMGAANTGEVYFLDPEVPVPYKVLPVEMTVLIDQNRLAEFMIALENSPMAIQVMEPEIAKPTTAVVKPVYGETQFAAGGMMGMMGGMGGMPGENMAAMMSGGYGRGGSGMMGGGPMMNDPSMMMGGMRSGMMGGMSGMGGMGGMGGTMAPKRTGTDLRGVNKVEERRQKAKDEAKKAKNAPKKSVDQYFNIVQLTIYGQARFYDTPAPPDAVESSSTATTPTAEGGAESTPTTPENPR